MTNEHVCAQAGSRNSALEKSTDVANAEVLRDISGKDLLHKTGYGWLVWNGKRWKPSTKLARLAAHPIGARLRWQAANQKDNDQAQRLLRHAKYCESSHGIDALLKEAAVLPPINGDHIELDADPNLLNLENGTIDLQNGVFREHRREEYITQLAPLEFHPEAECQRWIQFLFEVFEGNEELIDYMQWALGYALTGHTKVHIFFICVGDGRNGKSTLFSTVMDIMGRDYSQQVYPEVFLRQKHTQHPTDLAALRGCRLACAAEWASDRDLNEALIKGMTGGDPIRARYMRQDSFEYIPSMKIFVATNHLPRIKDSSTGMWERIRVIPFDAVFSVKAGNLDPHLRETLLAEKSGILNWALAGAQRSFECEPAIPQVVRSATDDYRMAYDNVFEFVKTNCVDDLNATVKRSDMYRAYLASLDDDGEHDGTKNNSTPFVKAVSDKEFVQRMRGLGIEEGRKHGGIRVWKGIRPYSMRSSNDG